MGHRILADKLDHISEAELGVQFDSDAIWNRLDSRVTAGQRNSWKRMLLVACLTLLVLLVPLSFLREDLPAGELVTEELPVVTEPVRESPKLTSETTEKRTRSNTPILELAGKDIDMGLETAEDHPISPQLTRIEVQSAYKGELFNNKDISIIQASLGKPKIETGRNVSIRAQWQASPTEVNVNYQALKIKLYEKNE